VEPGAAGAAPESMIRLALAALVVAYLPGAVLFRLPGRSQAYRAGLTWDERSFWAVILSTLWSLMVVLGLGALGRYSFNRLLLIDGLVVLLVVAAGGSRLSFRGAAPRPSWTLLIPAALIALGAGLYFPPAEYVVGGKDPGTYINEGVQIAQRGEVIVHDPDVAAVPAPLRDLFFPSHHQPTYYGLRFMGFFIQDPDDGRVVGQFPHLYPASIAVGYGLNGLSGARQAVGVWAILGLLAVYFAGSRLFGRAAGAAAAALLALNVVEIWFGRYPNSEMAMQALIFASLLAAGRARDGGGAFFGVVAGATLGLALFLRYEILLAFAAFAAAGVLAPVARTRLGWPFRVALAIASAAGLWYLAGPMRAYFAYPIGFVHERGGWLIAGAGLVVAIATNLALRLDALQALVRRWLPPAMAVALAALALYAYFIRAEGGRTALGDAMAFRTFGWYLTPWVLGLAVAGAVVLTATRFWRDPPFYLTFATFSVFFFYKTRIVAEHFWTSRRFLGVALPGALMLLTGAVYAVAVGVSGRRAGPSDPGGGDGTPAPSRLAAGIGVAALLAVTVPVAIVFWRASDPVRHHVEYAGLIPHLEQLAARIDDRDLVIVESRNAGSDLHVLAMPLAYIYARHVLVLDSAAPPKRTFETFVAWARTRYKDVYFLGGGGSDLLTREVSATPVAADHFQVPEYDAPINAYPSGVRRKEFEFGLYRLVPAAAVRSGPIDLAIGGLDDLNVVRFHGRERRADGTTFRWTQGQSFVLLLGLAPEARTVTVWMSHGGRPAKAPAAEVEVALDDQILGRVTVVDALRPYQFDLPPALVARLSAAADPVRLRLRVPSWNPQLLLGAPDTRDLGVIVTRVEVR
jgi:4-amino-4-deoxy-L-arabinose transferase-like glycosyltransferase